MVIHDTGPIFFTPKFRKKETKENLKNLDFRDSPESNFPLWIWDLDLGLGLGLGLVNL